MQNDLLLPTRLMCGYYDSRNFSSLATSSKYISTMFVFEYFLEDGGNMYSDDIAYPIRRNFALISSPGEERYSELPFKTKYIKFVADGRLAEILKNAPRYFHVSRSLEANTLLDEIITLHTVQGWDEIQLYGKLLAYISLLLDDAKRSTQVDSYKNGIIVKAQEYMKAHYGESIRLCDIAGAVNLSPNYFHTIFSETSGQTPREYLEEYRVSIAKRLLLTTQLTLSEIAERCGFHNQQYLTTVFKSCVGCSPTQFKRQYQSAYFN